MTMNEMGARAKTAARTRYSTRWVAEHQLLPLLASF